RGDQVVKRTIIVMAVAAVATAAIWCGSQLDAQGPAQAPAHTRVGFVNVARVFQEYKKAVFYKSELEKLIEPKKKERDNLVKEITGWTKEMQENPKLKKGDPQYDDAFYRRYEQGVLN